MRALLSGGMVITPSSRVRADILIDGERIAGMLESGAKVDVDQRYEIDGMLVFPGFIDPHVHSRDPGAPEKEDFAHCTKAAAAGGVTTILDMPNSMPAVVDAESFEERARQHEDVAHVDFGLWGLSTGAENLGELPTLFKAGAVAVKVFWGYYLDRSTRALVYEPGGIHADALIPPPDVGELLEVCRTVARLGGVLAAHCEESSILRAAARDLGRDVETYDDLLATRPVAAEAACIALGAELARATGCRFHVVHMASGRGVELVRQAQQKSIPLTAETCPHYLTLTAADHAALGTTMKVFPPIRDEEDRESLWRGVADGTITSIGSDHAPHTLEEKHSSLANAPAGVVGVETLVPLMLDAASSGRVGMERLAWILSEGTARLYGIYPRKGALRLGADADITVVDPAATWTISGDRLHSKQRFTPWDGQTVRGRAVLAFLRGALVMQDGEPVGQPRGKLVRRANPQVEET
jgi:dihydroorotase